MKIHRYVGRFLALSPGRRVFLALAALAWATATGASFTSLLITGDFLFEPRDPITGVGYVSPYFKVAAPATMLAITVTVVFAFGPSAIAKIGASTRRY